MLPIHQRLAELWLIQKKRTLTRDERDEMNILLDANARYAEKMARLENLSYVAYATEDYEWLHDICAEIDKLQDQLVAQFNRIRRKFDRAAG